MAPRVVITGSVQALGGQGGPWASDLGRPFESSRGGNGGVGRIRIDTDDLTGTTDPAPGFIGPWVP